MTGNKRTLPNLVLVIEVWITRQQQQQLSEAATRLCLCDLTELWLLAIDIVADRLQDVTVKNTFLMEDQDQHPRRGARNRITYVGVTGAQLSNIKRVASVLRVKHFDEFFDTVTAWLLNCGGVKWIEENAPVEKLDLCGENLRQPLFRDE